jgi:hypothetical protein
MDATEAEALGTFTFKRWAGEARDRGVNLDHVTFP